MKQLRKSRRDVLSTILFAFAAGGLGTPAAAMALASRSRTPRRIRAIAFDAFVLFSPRPIMLRAREIAGDKADALVAAASAKLFSYTWFYTSAGHYAGFDQLARFAFQSAAESLGLTPTSAELDRLVAGYAGLDLWPDVRVALQALRTDGVRLAMLSNLSEHALRANLRAGGVDDLFEFVLSTDQARQFKPSPLAYDLAVRAFRLPAQEIGFAASASWDASGATWFGFPTVWVNRNHLSADEAHAAPMFASSGMEGVLKLAAFGAA